MCNCIRESAFKMDRTKWNDKFCNWMESKGGFKEGFPGKIENKVDIWLKNNTEKVKTVFDYSDYMKTAMKLGSKTLKMEEKDGRIHKSLEDVNEDRRK